MTETCRSCVRAPVCSSMVMLSSYDSFVSRLDLASDSDKLDWLGRMDYTSLKN